MYRPSESAQMTARILLQTPETVNSYGVRKKVWSTSQEPYAANFKTFGGTEKTDNGILSVEDTAQVTMWYDPAVAGNCRVILCDGTELSENPKIYEILGEPENIECRNQFMKFKVRRIKGGA